MRQLLAALGDNVKPRGKGWICRCPVHNDKDFAMSINVGRDRPIVAYCYVCEAGGLELYQALGVDLEEYFGKKLERDANYMPRDVKELLDLDRTVVKIYRRQEERGVYASLEDKRRYKLAKGRIIGVQQKYGL